MFAKVLTVVKLCQTIFKISEQHWVYWKIIKFWVYFGWNCL